MSFILAILLYAIVKIPWFDPRYPSEYTVRAAKVGSRVIVRSSPVFI